MERRLSSTAAAKAVLRNISFSVKSGNLKLVASVVSGNCGKFLAGSPVIEYFADPATIFAFSSESTVISTCPSIETEIELKSIRTGRVVAPSSLTSQSMTAQIEISRSVVRSVSLFSLASKRTFWTIGEVLFVGTMFWTALSPSKNLVRAIVNFISNFLFCSVCRHIVYQI